MNPVGATPTSEPISDYLLPIWSPHYLDAIANDPNLSVGEKDEKLLLIKFKIEETLKSNPQLTPHVTAIYQDLIENINSHLSVNSMNEGKMDLLPVKPLPKPFGM